MNITSYTVTNGANVPIIAQSLCNNITIGESPAVAGYPTTAYLVYKNVNGAPSAAAFELLAGLQYTFNDVQKMGIGTLVGWVILVAAASSTTFIQDES